MSITTAMILAAGRGERLRPLTDSTPKPLIEIAGKHLIEYHIENLARAGIKNIVINTSWLSEQIHQTLGDGSNYGTSIQYSDEPEALETAGGIIKALPLLGETFIVINGDIWTDFDFSAWKNMHLSKQAHLILVNNPEHNLEGDFALKDEMLMNSGPTMYTYSGIGIYTAEFFAGVQPGKVPLAPIIRQKNDAGLVSADLFQGEWLDVGNIQRLEQLREVLDRRP
jgi:N-acetyl-alpha-D-muramate 1-phosphate uridylyltransferase